MKRSQTFISTLVGFLPSIVLVILPKCPFCALAYAGIFSSLGISHEFYESYLQPTIYVLLIISGLSLFISATHRKNYYAFLMFSIGLIFLFTGRNVLDIQWIMLTGFIMIVGSILLNTIMCNKASKITMMKSK